MVPFNGKAVMVVGVDDIREALVNYHKEWRHPRLTPLHVSGIYDLFPNRPTTFNVQHRWHQKEAWPNADFPGVYFVFDANLNLLYVGQSSKMGRRLSQWFKGSVHCDHIHGSWKTDPRFVATVPVARHFEALALEGHLIDLYGPPENTSLKRIAAIVEDAQEEAISQETPDATG
jgi:hypothetical protein